VRLKENGDEVRTGAGLRTGAGASARPMVGESAESEIGEIMRAGAMGESTCREQTQSRNARALSERGRDCLYSISISASPVVRAIATKKLLAFRMAARASA
jgi:hypothetical protein